MKILMVCLGNICRSPLAEGVLKDKIDHFGLDWEVASAGTSAWHTGEKPDPRSIRVGHNHGLDITGQKARQFEKADFEKYDLILVMDSSNYQDVLKLTDDPAQKEKVRLIMNFVKPGYNQNVPDPYWDDDGFEKVYQMLDKAADEIVKTYAEKVND